MPDQNDSQQTSLPHLDADPADSAADENGIIVSDEAQDGRDSSLSSFRIVAIGASAGGVEAYIELFKNLPPDTGMAYVVIPHLSADSKSFLPEIVLPP